MYNRYRNEEYLTPPGVLTELLSHPVFRNTKTIELGLFYEHRYAFFFWLKWSGRLRKANPDYTAPALVTLDWHQDLCPEDKDELAKLDQNSNKEVALYSWLGMSPNNDGHIMAGTYLNAIGNVYVWCRQGNFESDWEDEVFTDISGKPHVIRKFKTCSALIDALTSSNERQVYFDIDLDFFTIDNPYNDSSDAYTYMDSNEIRSVLAPQGALMTWLLKDFVVLTIAIEPEHTGGLAIANKYLDLINAILFNPPLFTNHGNNWEKDTQWRHFQHNE